jgi:hypothetical protein
MAVNKVDFILSDLQNPFDFGELNGVNQVSRLVTTPLTQVNSCARF